MKIFFRNFFRSDLNLGSRWWHRFLSVVFILLSLSLTIYTISEIFTSNELQQWRKVAALSERVSSDIKSMGDLVKPGEKIGENNRTYVLNDPPGEYYKGILNDVYCSTKLSDNIENIREARNIENLYIRSLYGRNNTSLTVFTNYIKQNDIKCVILDAYSYSDGGKLTFMEPDKSYQENWSFYEKSSSATVMYVLKMVSIILAVSIAVFTGITVFYYKVLLYIIFGSRKNLDKEVI